MQFFAIVENTRSVSKNLGCRGIDDGMRKNANHVDVLIPEVIEARAFGLFSFLGCSIL